MRNLLGILALVLISSSAVSQALPDLTLDANRLSSSVTFQRKRFAGNSCALQEGCVLGQGRRNLLRFDTSTPNVGTGDLILGRPQDNPSLYEFSSCHGHYHFSGYALYELLDLAGNVVLRGRKQAFCLEDVTKFDPSAGSAKYDCSFQGISAGWSDVYGSYLDCQWLDVTNISKGLYTLRVTVNPEHSLPESDYSNNVAEVQVRLKR